MHELRTIEAEHTRDPAEGFDGGLDVASLLKPRVPADADAGEKGHLLAPQPGGAPRPRRQTQLARQEARAPAAKERPERFALLRQRLLQHEVSTAVRPDRDLVAP